MLITIGGLPGTGTSTLAKKITERFGFEYYYTGKIIREMAKNYNMNLLEFLEYLKYHPDIDIEIDNKMIEIAKTKNNIILEGRVITPLLLKNNVHPDLSIWLKCSFKERCLRIAQRENKELNEVYKETKRREELEIEKFKKLYNINILNTDYYHIIIDTEKFNKDETYNIISKIIEGKLLMNQYGYIPYKGRDFFKK